MSFINDIMSSTFDLYTKNVVWEIIKEKEWKKIQW